jgi:simple sugar transport system substrate-binding protein
MRRALLALLVLGSLSACGRASEVQEPDLVVHGDQAVTARPSPDSDARGLRIAAARIVVITHGQASDPFWSIVKRGGQDAGRQTGVAVSYRAPDTYDIARMQLLIDQAVADRPDGMVVSLPDAAALGPAIKRAVAAGIPVVTINSGSDQFRALGVLAHVGQPEYRAGFEGGKRMAAAGVRNAVCVNQEVGNAGLDVRCRAFAAGLATRGGHSRVLAVNLQDPSQSQRRIAEAIGSGEVDGIITLGPGGAMPALAAVRAGGLADRVTLATFDLSPEVLAAVRDGQMLFAIDQQPYLQGYLPVILLAEQARHDIFPAQGELIPTGPHFVTKDHAAEAMALSAQGIR